jgi:NAD(P)-dependent dehydrogenase (short-subunit alcohol dehydrogenase family)
MDLDGRVALVTGGGSGIGAACAEQLRTAGAHVVTWDRAGGDIQCDVSDADDVARALARTVRETGVPTVLVTAAGTAGRPAPFHEMEVGDLDRTLAVNLTGTFLVMRAVTGAMVEAGRDGSVVAISSVNGQIVDPGHAAYSASKAGVNHLCRVAASDLGASGIRVNAVAPGPTATAMLGDRALDPEWVAEVEAITPLGRVGTPELVADVVLAVMRTDWVTGQVVTADGGAGLQTARGRWRLPNAGRSPHAAPVVVR